MYQTSLLASLSILLATGRAQQVATSTAETHPKLTSQKCTTAGGCTDQSTSIVLDANWRWLHTTSGSTNCYTGNEWDTSICTDVDTCTSSCALDGVDYEGTYGITADGNSLTMTFVTEGSYSTNIGSRVYLLAADSDTEYELFQLKNQEFTFDVDVSNLPCGLNGALYFSEMDADGGMSKYSTNKAGAKYGTGYCDTQCPHDLKFINGEANMEDWVPSTNDANSGTGKYGSCCNEMDIWEANSQATALTPHVCTANTTGQVRCEGTECGDGDNRYGGVCDKDGCDFNSYRLGNDTFYGSGMTVDTASKFTVVTQFITSDGTADGDLVEIRRKYVQGSTVIENSYADYETLSQYNSITDDFCDAQKTLFGDTNDFKTKGGLARMGESFARGMVLVMSIWDDHTANALWLDSVYPVNATATDPGVTRGSCATDSGVPSEVESASPDASVIYSNIRYGDINSTTTTTS